MSRGTARWEGELVSLSKDVRGVEVCGALAREALLGRPGLPARDHCGESDPRRGEGKGVVFPVTLYPSPWRTSAENQGVALTTSTPPVRRAVTPGGRGTREAQPRFAFPQRTRGNPCCPASDAAFQGSPQPQRRGLRPLREKRCGCHNHVTLQCHPPLLKGGHPYGGI